MGMQYRPLFPYFGGKSKVSDVIWEKFGSVNSYIEPFCGSAAVLLKKPDSLLLKASTINDIDGFIVNLWRSLKFAADEVEYCADYPPTEQDLLARNRFLKEERDSLTEYLIRDPMFYSTKHAGWWLWGAGIWLGRGWASTDYKHKLPAAPKAFCGIHRRTETEESLHSLIFEVSAKLKKTRITCGDWRRVLTNCNFLDVVPAGIFLDPPYSTNDHNYSNAYYHNGNPFNDCVAWCKENGRDRRFRIALSGYATNETSGLQDLGWTVYNWDTKGRMNNRSNASDGSLNSSKERIWFSPTCEQ